jgi:hypothetical protein
MVASAKVFGMPSQGEFFNLNDDMDIEPQIGGTSNQSKGP